MSYGPCVRLDTGAPPAPRVRIGFTCRTGRWVYEYGVTNVEYTEFEKLGLSDEAVSAGSKTSVFPANTNVLYVGMRAAQRVVAEVGYHTLVMHERLLVYYAALPVAESCLFISFTAFCSTAGTQALCA